MIFSHIDPAISDLIGHIVASLPADMPVYLVGGAVRDLFLQRPIHDLDFILPRNAIKFGRRIANQLEADFYPLDSGRDNGRVIVNGLPFGRIRLDFARQRGRDIESDLRDRDFTINAIALDLRHPDQLLDPCGGAKDLLKKELYLCSSDALVNDPVRIIRAVRISVQLGFKISSETIKAIRPALPGLRHVTPERLRDELFRVLDSEGSASAIRLMDSIGALNYVLPELSDIKGFSQPEPHFFDLWDHTLTALQQFDAILQTLDSVHRDENAANWAMGLVTMRLGRYRKKLQSHLSTSINLDRSLVSLIRMAILFHDVGKPLSVRKTDENKIVFYGHDLEGEKIVRYRASALRLSNHEIDRLGQIIRGHMRPLQLANGEDSLSPRAIYRFFRDLGPAGVDVCLVSLADMLATFGPALPQDAWPRHVNVVRSLLEAWWEHPVERISPPALVDGDDLMNVFRLKPGPLVGELLEQIKEAQAAGEISQPEEALKLARDVLDQGKINSKTGS